MLSFNFAHILKARGIQHPVRFLMKAGLSRRTSDKLLQGDAYAPRLEHIEKLCIALNCTPNDILVWRPSANTGISADHPLNTLRAKEKTYNLLEKLKTLPLENIDAIEAMLATALLPREAEIESVPSLTTI